MAALDIYEVTLENGNKRPFYYRASSVGDRGVIGQVFMQYDYQLERFSMAQPLQRYAAHHAVNNELLIIDAGANIGAASVYFATKYLRSRIVAIEPEKNNCELLRKNCSDLSVHLIEGALGCELGTMYLQDPGNSDWGFRVGQEGGAYPVDVVSIEHILASTYAVGTVPFICKIDIEGGEESLFQKNFSWLSQFPAVIIELHDWMLPGQGNSWNFRKALAGYNYDFLLCGENAVCFNNDILRSFF